MVDENVLQIDDGNNYTSYKNFLTVHFLKSEFLWYCIISQLIFL